MDFMNPFSHKKSFDYRNKIPAIKRYLWERCNQGELALLWNPPTELKNMFQPTVEHFVIRELSEQNVELTFGVTVTWWGETHQAAEVVCRRKPGSEPLQNRPLEMGCESQLSALWASAPHLYPWGWGWGLDKWPLRSGPVFGTLWNVCNVWPSLEVSSPGQGTECGTYWRPTVDRAPGVLRASWKWMHIFVGLGWVSANPSSLKKLHGGRGWWEMGLQRLRKVVPPTPADLLKGRALSDYPSPHRHWQRVLVM